MSYPTMKENLEHKKHGTVHKAVNCYSDQSLCDRVWERLDYYRTSKEVTCKVCLKIMKSNEVSKKEEKCRLLNIKMIKSYQTSDGKMHNTEKAAIMHEEWLERNKSKEKFAQFVRKDIFGNPNPKLEDEILEDIEDKVSWILSDEEYNLEGFSETLWQLFDGFDGIIDKALSKFREMKTK